MSLTGRGWAVLGGGVAWCVLAVVVGQRDLWWPGIFLALLPVTSWLLLLPGSGELGVERRVAPSRVTAGQTARVDLVLDPGGLGTGGVARVRDQLTRLKDQAFGAHGSDSVAL